MKHKAFVATSLFMALVILSACVAPAAPAPAPTAAAPAPAAATPAPAATAAPTAKPLQKVTVQLGWLKNSEFAGLFAADKLGYYKDAGLQVDFISGGSGIDPIPIVRANPNFIGIVSSTGTLINAISKGAPLVSIGAFYQKHPNGFLVLKDGPIKTWKDFEGRKIGVQPEGEYYLDVVSSIQGLDKSKMQVVRVGSDPSPLLTGQLDAYMAWIVNQPYAVEKAGKQWDFLLLADNPGLHIYAMAPFVSKTLLEKDPELLQRWTCATLKGWAYVIDNPDAAAKMVAENYLPGGDPAAEKWLLGRANPISVSEDTKKYGLGWQDPQAWKDTVDVLLKYKQIDTAPAVADMMTNQFVEKCAEKK